jgi:hypothetical protein
MRLPGAHQFLRESRTAWLRYRLSVTEGCGCLESAVVQGCSDLMRTSLADTTDRALETIRLLVRELAAAYHVAAVVRMNGGPFTRSRVFLTHHCAVAAILQRERNCAWKSGTSKTRSCRARGGRRSAFLGWRWSGPVGRRLVVRSCRQLAVVFAARSRCRDRQRKAHC